MRIEVRYRKKDKLKKIIDSLPFDTTDIFFEGKNPIKGVVCEENCTMCFQKESGENIMFLTPNFVLEADILCIFTPNKNDLEKIHQELQFYESHLLN